MVASLALAFVKVLPARAAGDQAGLGRLVIEVTSSTAVSAKSGTTSAPAPVSLRSPIYFS